MIGYVPQETILLHDTIYNNISLGNSRLDESHIIASLEKAGAWDFVQELPIMLNYVVGERGGGLSGGQRKCISIARALVNQPEILLLGEATSALDPVSEIAICDTLIKLRGKLTIMMISRQPALLKIADHAYLIKDLSAEPIQPNMLLSHPLAAMNTVAT
jgi:ATP-binding cassette subfamily C protein